VDEQIALDTALVAIVCGLVAVAAALHEATEQLLRLGGLRWSGDGVGAAQVEGGLWTETEGIFGKSLPRRVRLRVVSENA
jgi:hypothetical protein